MFLTFLLIEQAIALIDPAEAPLPLPISPFLDHFRVADQPAGARLLSTLPKSTCLRQVIGL